MAFRRFDLQEAVFVPGIHAFRAPGSQPSIKMGPERRGAMTPPPPSRRLLRCNYFEVARGLLHPGELNGRQHDPETESPVNGRAPSYRLLMMVRGNARGAISVRLVQDFGRPGEPTRA
jgi:hypothetical protein